LPSNYARSIDLKKKRFRKDEKEEKKREQKIRNEKGERKRVEI